MTKPQYAAFDQIRAEFRDYVESLADRAPWLAALQEELRLARGYDDYRVETPVVYNEALDEVGRDEAPRFIIVADNPGKNEQKAANRRYLVGQSGKLAQGWFRKELDLDFRSSSVIINKTPIHTPKTAEIALLGKLSGRHRAELGALLDESQRRMAGFAFRMHESLGCVLWVSGYGELRPKGLFSAWAEETTRLYAAARPALRKNLWVFRHFSMNQFAIEYARFKGAGPTGREKSGPMERLEAIGAANRKRILGW